MLPKTLSFCFKQQQASRGDPPEHAACNWGRSSGTTQKKPGGRRVTWSFCASSLSRLPGLKTSRSVPPQSERMWTYTENGAAAALSRFHSTPTIMHKFPVSSESLFALQASDSDVTTTTTGTTATATPELARVDPGCSAECRNLGRFQCYHHNELEIFKQVCHRGLIDMSPTTRVWPA